MEQKKENADLKPVSAKVMRIARQVEKTFNDKGSLWNTYFYKVVLAGNVPVIKQVVDYLQSKGSMQALDWLFQRGHFEEKRHIHKRTSERLLITRMFIFVGLMIVSILLTPIFYALHLMSTSFLNRKQRRISADIRLPLAYAAFSRNKHMVLFFLSQGADIEHMDHQGNTVFHYISDLSSVAADTAVQIFRDMVSEINDRERVKRLLERHRNSAGLTAVEYAAKFGSPALLSQILKQPNIMHQTPFSASTDHVAFNDDDDEKDDGDVASGDGQGGSIKIEMVNVAFNDDDEKDDGDVVFNDDDEKYDGDVAFNDDDENDDGDVASADGQDASIKIEMVDVSMYEAGKLVDQSALLNILSDRDVANMSRTDLQIFADTNIIGQWLIFKCKQMMCGVLFFQLCDFIITCLLLLVLNNSFLSQNGVAFLTWRLEEDHKVQLAEITAWSHNTSEILKPTAFHEQIDKQILSLQQNWLANMWKENPDEVEDLFNVSSLYSFLGDQAVPGVAMDGWNVSFTALNNTDIEVLLEHAQKMPQIAENVTQTRIFQLFPQILSAFSAELMMRKSEFFDGFDGYYQHEEEISLLYENFTIEDGDAELTPASALPVDKLFFLMCQYLGELNADDFADTLPPYSGITYADLQTYAYDTCFYQVFMNNAIKDQPCQESDKKLLLQKMFDFYSNEETRHIYNGIKLVVIVCNYLYVLLDILERCVFLTKSVVYQTHTADMLLTALGQKVPGSYTRKQLNILSCLTVILYYHVHEAMLAMSNLRSNNTYFKYESLAAMICIVAIVVRFLMHIHSLRLLPGIGHFVITTFMMGTNLLHFSAIMGIVMLIFSMLFHFLIDNSACPMEKAQGFATMYDSLFSTFQLTFSHGNLDPFKSSAPVKLTYTLYVTIVGLLLLNLIIAIMGSTAMAIMAEPWRDVLWKVEWLDEVTAVEYTFSVITLPIRRLRPGSLGYRSHKKVGFIVKRLRNKKYRVYIECFHCPALQEQHTADS